MGLVSECAKEQSAYGNDDIAEHPLHDRQFSLNAVKPLLVIRNYGCRGAGFLFTDIRFSFSASYSSTIMVLIATFPHFHSQFCMEFTANASRTWAE
jgi:hypothetical protein